MKERKEVEKRKLRIHLIALVLTAAFVLGIFFVIFGGIKGMTFLLVLGIVCTVAGFYCMPIAWIKYVEAKKYVSLEHAVITDGLRRIKDIAWQVGATEEAARNAVSYALENRLITGLKFDVDADELIDLDVKPKKGETVCVKCPACGAVTNVSAKDPRCEYCGSPIKIGK